MELAWSSGVKRHGPWIWSFAASVCMASTKSILVLTSPDGRDSRVENIADDANDLGIFTIVSLSVLGRGS